MSLLRIADLESKLQRRDDRILELEAALAAQPPAVVAIPEPSEDEVDLLLAEIDQVARNYDHHDYGLPTFDDDSVASMRAQVQWFFESWTRVPQPLAGQQDRGEATGDAETYLRGRYGAYRGHFAWRELEEAFNAGAAKSPSQPLVEVQEPVGGAKEFCWCIESQNSADWCFAADLEGVLANAKLLDPSCIRSEPFKLYAAPVRGLPLTEERIDDFNGDNAALCWSIEALLSLDAAGALVPHGVGGHARSLLSAASVRLGGGK